MNLLIDLEKRKAMLKKKTFECIMKKFSKCIVIGTFIPTRKKN